MNLIDPMRHALRTASEPASWLLTAGVLLLAPIAALAENPTEEALAEIEAMDVQRLDWPSWGGWSHKNNTPLGENIPTEWDIEAGENVLWQMPLGSQTYGNPVVANGKAYVGTNNHHGYLDRYPSTVDLGVLVCFDAETGEFLWQHSSPKLPTGRVHDWPDQGICCAPYVDGDRLWFVSSRGEVICLDAEGFRDGENDGDQSEVSTAENEADVIWSYDMMGRDGVSQHNMCSCSVMCVGDTVFVNTSNGVDESHINIPAPDAPSFIALNRDTGELLWSDKSPGVRILHGQWSSPSYCEIGGRPQVLAGLGDGWLYSFDPKGDGNGDAKILWKFDCNPKESVWILGGRGTRNNLIATPVVYGDMVYVAVGQDPEHGEGPGHLWCIDPTGEGDVSLTRVVENGEEVMPERLRAVEAETPENADSGRPELPGYYINALIDPDTRESGKEKLAALQPKAGAQVVYNENSKAVWHYGSGDNNGDGEVDYEEEMHRSCGTVAIKDDLLYIADFSGIFHCLDAKTGKPHWTYDMFTAAWGSPLIVEGHVYVGNEDGGVLVFELDAEANEPLVENFMDNAVYSTPIVANNTIYISNKRTLFAIREGAKSDPAD